VRCANGAPRGRVRGVAVRRGARYRNASRAGVGGRTARPNRIAAEMEDLNAKPSSHVAQRGRGRRGGEEDLQVDELNVGRREAAVRAVGASAGKMPRECVGVYGRNGVQKWYAIGRVQERAPVVPMLYTRNQPGATDKEGRQETGREGRNVGSNGSASVCAVLRCVLRQYSNNAQKKCERW